MPGKGPIASDEKWVVTIDVSGARSVAESNRAKAALDKLIAKWKKPGRKASWKGKTTTK